MTVSETTPEAPRLPEVPERPMPAARPPSEEARERATRTHDPRAIAEYLVLRRAK